MLIECVIPGQIECVFRGRKSKDGSKKRPAINGYITAEEEEQTLRREGNEYAGICVLKSIGSFSSLMSVK